MSLENPSTALGKRKEGDTCFTYLQNEERNSTLFVIGSNASWQQLLQADKFLPLVH